MVLPEGTGGDSPKQAPSSGTPTDGCVARIVYLCSWAICFLLGVLVIAQRLIEAGGTQPLLLPSSPGYARPQCPARTSWPQHGATPP